jgi:2-methylcitrate dehydratase PrpD
MAETKTLVAACRKISFDAFSEDVVARTKDLFLDFVGVAARGALEDSSAAMNRVVQGLDQNAGTMPVPGVNFCAHPANAALAIGTAAHSIELDDVINASSLHPAVAVMPAALAAAFLGGCSGRRFIEGIITGYEVMSRLGIALHPANQYERGFHPTGTCGTLGAAMTAAKILGLSEKQMTSALGIAGSQAAGSMEFLSDGSMTKRLHPGWAAHGGVIAALLAREGFTGPETILEGRFGFLHAFSSASNKVKIMDGWGSPFQVMRSSIKPHACCRYMQGPIDALLDIMQQNALQENDIRKATVGVLKTGFPIVVDPLETKTNPRTVVDAQFSMPFGAAVAMLYGRAFLDEFTMDNVTSEKVRQVMGKIKCVSDANLEAEYPNKWKAHATVETTKGQTFTTTIEYPKGDPENPLRPDELEDKFRALTKPVYTGKKADAIIAGIKKLDQYSELKKFIGGLSSI